MYLRRSRRYVGWTRLEEDKHKTIGKEETCLAFLESLLYAKLSCRLV